MTMQIRHVGTTPTTNHGVGNTHLPPKSIASHLQQALDAVKCTQNSAEKAGFIRVIDNITHDKNITNALVYGAILPNDILNGNTSNWSRAVHNKILEKSLSGAASDSDIRYVQGRSLRQDIGDNGSQNHMHFLRNPGQSSIEAKKLWRDYIIGEAVYARLCQSRGNRNEALYHFGNAAHALQDSYSPVHQNDGHPDVYHDYAWSPAMRDGIKQNHSPLDSIGKEGTDDLMPKTEKMMIEDTKRLYDFIMTPVNMNSEVNSKGNDFGKLISKKLSF